MSQWHYENPAFEGILEYIWTISLHEKPLFNLFLTDRVTHLLGGVAHSFIK